ncbi:MAG: tetratricopeptide repeat protein, partial [Bradymonadia bacterium]
PTSDTGVGFVGQYNEVLGQCFRALDKLLNVSMPKVADRLEKVNGHWKFRGRAPNRAFAQWLRWIKIKERAGSVSGFDLPLNFWRYLVWSVLEDYNVEDFSGWLRVTANLSEEYANVDALELTDGLAFFFRALKLNADVIGPGTYPFYFNQGVRAFKASDYRGAEAMFREALRFDGTQHDAHFNLGLCLYRLEDYEGAAQAWLVGTGLPGASADIFYHRGVAFFRLKSMTKAALMFRAALAKNSRHKRAAKWLRVVDPKNKTRPKKSRRKRRRRRR